MASSAFVDDAVARILGLLALVAVGCAPAAESTRQESLTTTTCVTFQRGHGNDLVADSYVKRNALHKNFGGKPALRVSNSDEALLRFDLTKLPRAATVTKATLKLFANGEAGNGTIHIHRITAPWTESDVTYASFQQAFAPAPVAALRVESKTTQKSVDVTSVVASWARLAQPNYGFELDAGPDHHPAQKRHGDDDNDPTLFVSSEGPAARRPALEVCYSVFSDECAASPCHNDGTCSNANPGYTCACAPGFGGPTCDVVLDHCAAQPCLHGGGCTNGTEGYTCLCSAGFGGANCEINVDDCAAQPCEHGGVCTDGIAGRTCACAPGFDGASCENVIDNCKNGPCKNGGACSNVTNGFTCICPTGFSGATCDTNIDDCAQNPCVNGTCVDGIASYTCLCPPGFEGATCETPVVPPVPTPPEAYEAPNAPVDDATTMVATIPRPPHVTVEPASHCPYDAPDLVTLDPSWVTQGGALHIPANTRVIVHGNDELPATTLLRQLHIPATSELVFADQPATFRVTDIMVDGTLRLGSPTCRLESAIRFDFDTDENVSDAAVRTAIFNRMGLGIMVGSSGVLEMFGHLYQPTWTRLAATASAGASVLALAEAVDWQPGQQLVVATSARVDYPIADENELRTITSVQNGTQVMLDRPLNFQHYGGPEYQVEVGLLSRNLQFRTSDRVAAAAPTFGGHIMVHSKNARVSGVELYGMGQQNFLARYPFHFHRAGDVAGASYFTDSSIWRSNWRCAVIHRTDRSLVSRNVAYDNFGSCYYLEDGVEMNNEVSFNLAVRTKIMGPTDQISIENMRGQGQIGFTLAQSASMVQPADRAAAGFYISNGNNRVIGNASSGGFAGYSFPNLPQALGGSPEGILPILYGASHFDGNTAHTAGYLWSEGGACVYVGGTLTEENGQLTYSSGRSTDWNLLRHRTEVFNNTKTFLCETGIVHWGSNPRIVNFESWNNGLLAKLFGAASIQSSLVVAETRNVRPKALYGWWDTARPLSGYQRGFQFYDTGTQTVLRDVAFRSFHRDPSPGMIKEWDNCALLSMTHSDQYTPQQMNTVAGLHFTDVDHAERLCISDRGTLSSRNFNVLDTDGSLSRVDNDGLPAGPRLVASAYTSAWRFSNECVVHDAWGALVCPLQASQGVASVGTVPNAGVRVTMYGLDNTLFGDNWYSPTDFIEAQITGPSGVGWHHAFPSGVPETFDVQVLQVPDASFVLLSLTLPAGVSCSIAGPDWSHVPNVSALLASSGAAYTTAQSTCFVRIPPTHIGDFQASGLAVPNMTWRGNPTPTTYFTITTGCHNSNPACQTVVSELPTL